MSKSNLLAVFKEATGHSPIEYLIRLRLHNAAEMLASTSLSISEIAAECGFADSNYLTRQFRKIYNISPREFRKNSLRPAK
jgi:AraC-like DNA-binding protein